MANTKTEQKSFWGKPEGKTGALFLAGVIGIGGWLLYAFLGTLLTYIGGLIGKVVIFGVLAVLIFMALDPKTRKLVSYMYQSVMRKITGIFITIDPIGILKNYTDDLADNLKKMGKQIGNLKGQARKLKTMVSENNKEIEKNIMIARKAKEQKNQKAMLLSTRKAARLKDTNGKYIVLHKKISVLYKVLTKMYSNSEVLLEDTKDQVRVKEQERKAIRASHGAMKSAMSIIKGDPDKRAMFDQAMEHVADDVASKIGEMEQFMEMSSDFMDSIDLQNGVFEEKGMQMLAEYEKKSTLLLLGGQEQMDEDILDLKQPEIQTNDLGGEEGYEGMFD